MSQYIENSKHGAMTAAVEDHFGTAKARTMPGEASGKGMPQYGESSPVPGIPDGSGFNYEPKSDTGHTTR